MNFIIRELILRVHIFRKDEGEFVKLKYVLYLYLHFVEVFYYWLVQLCKFVKQFCE